MNSMTEQFNSDVAGFEIKIGAGEEKEEQKGDD